MISILWLLPLLGAAALIACPSAGKGDPWKIALLFCAAGLAHLAWLSAGWSPESFPRETREWIPSAGLALEFWLDGPALFYAWLVQGIGFLVVFYAGFYMKPDDAPWRFYSSLLLFLAAMLGLVLARDLLLMFVFWEATSLTSFLLIGHWHQDPEARKGARRALLATGLGGLALMAGAALLGVIVRDAAGSFDLRFDTLWALREAIGADARSGAALVLLLLGAFTKSAQFPFHFWLPGAMKAPTPVSALLHAATMVKAGIYLLGRLYPVFNDQFLWLALVGGAGVASMLVGGWLALFSHDIKKLLAYSTVSQLGLLTAYYGFGYQRVGGDELLKLDLLLVASHALFKAGLFMLCGVVDHGAHTRDWRRLGGLRRKMPWTAALSVLACLSMAGMPFTLGFVAKKLFLEASFKLQGPPLWLEGALIAGAVLASVFTVAYCAIAALYPFFGEPRDAEIHARAHEGGLGILAAPALLVGACVAGGIYVPLIEKPVSLLTRDEFLGAKSGFVTAWFGKADLLFWVSMAMYFVAAPLLLAFRGRIERLGARAAFPSLCLGTADWLLDSLMPRLGALAGALAKPATHKRTLALVFLTFAGAVLGGALISSWPAFEGLEGSPVEALAAFLSLLAAAGAFGAVRARSPLAKILCMSFSGLMTAALFVLWKAPDLAATQLLVELASLLMFLALAARLKLLPPRHDAPSRSREALAISASLAVGAAAGFAAWMASASHPEAQWPARPSTADFYLANSLYPERAGEHSGGGRNAVNVTLVDFRALDTLGEVLVLAVAAMGVFCLLGLRFDSLADPRAAKKPKRRKKKAPTPGLDDPPLFILGVYAPLIGLFCGVYALELFVAGHQAPGGGFIAGLLASIAFAPALILGERLKLPAPPFFLGAGVLCMLATGLWPAVTGGEPFLKSAFGSVSVPLLGEWKLSSALGFDAGVFLVVFGVTLALMKHFAMKRVRTERSGT